METAIKRIAQFLFDNAEQLKRELLKSSDYRSLGISLDMFKSEGKPELSISLSFYHKNLAHKYLHNDNICIEHLNLLLKQMDLDSGITIPPSPIEVRKSL